MLLLFSKDMHGVQIILSLAQTQYPFFFFDLSFSAENNKAMDVEVEVDVVE
jgi:hypothetical protein